MIGGRRRRRAKAPVTAAVTGASRPGARPREGRQRTEVTTNGTNVSVPDPAVVETVVAGSTS